MLKDTISDLLSDSIIRSYYNNNISLIRTLGFKFGIFADKINEELIRVYGDGIVDPYTPETWKYYLNLAGEYHITDQIMTIISLDTIEEITFDKSNLALHPNTKEAYKFGTRYFHALVNKYPSQLDLILGIILPSDIDVSIDAVDGTILRYDSSFVEPQEHSLIYDLQEYIKRHISRWYISAYTIVDSYYHMAYYNGLVLSLLPKLLNLRDSRRNTYEAHSFHIKMLLKGYMNLDKYYPYMTSEQAFYLYRNLPRLVRYIGHEKQFNELLEVILTKRQIPLSNYLVRHRLDIDQEMYPIPIVQVEKLNSYSNYGEDDTIELEDLFDKEETVLYGTEDYYKANIEAVIKQIKNSPFSSILTKDLSSNVINYKNSLTESIEEVVLRHWGYMASHQLYTGTIQFENPKTGEIHTTNVLAAFTYIYYLSLSSLGYDITTIPAFLVEKRVRSPKPTIGQLLSVVPSTLKEEFKPIAQYLLDEYVELTMVNKPEDFFNICQRIYQNLFYQRQLIGLTFSVWKKAYMKNMVYQLYQDELFYLYDVNTNINDFLIQNNLSVNNYSIEELNTLISEIYIKGSGTASRSTELPQNIQKAMIDIMRRLTSYSVQYIDNSNENDLTNISIEQTYISSESVNSYATTDEVLEQVINTKIGVTVLETTKILN